MKDKDVLSNVYTDEDGEHAWVRNATSEIEAAYMYMKLCLEDYGFLFVDETLWGCEVEEIENCLVIELDEENIQFIDTEKLESDLTSEEMGKLESVYHFFLKKAN